MKRTLLCILSLLMTIIIKAGDVTPEVAMKQAADFVKQRVANGSRRAPSASQLTMTKKVSGLYVINIGKSEGFVIVSPDDRTDAILGYADSGNLNPDNMPENMKAWLQGYADEIAWAKRNNITASATTAQRAHRAVKTAIAPLVTAQWNQSEPYNNKCPAFFEYGQCVTGCVATAMAQVLYYTATKADVGESTISKAIAAYDCKRNWGGLGQIHVDEVEASTTFKWNKMKDTYTSSETGEAADAVATLMKACGASVNMDYSNVDNGGSSANSDIIDDALIKYFGYDETTQYADRSFYSYLNWIDLLYNELSQGRAILYSGQSIGGGHEFVCDGYQGEDYFHINWGWGGKSDGFFKLAALDPDEQGIGGSTSTEGYNAGQSAVIGIQLKGGSGTVLDVHENTVNLTLNGVSADKTSITTDEIANITFNITNNSKDIYDGEIGIKIIDGDLGDGKMFIIPAGGTKDCVVEFRPLATGTYKITAYKPNGKGGYGSIDDSKFFTVTVDGGSGTLPSSSDLDLTASLKSIENANAGKTEVYGNSNLESTIKAVITITNPSTTTNFKGRFSVYMNFADNPGYYYVTTKTISIPAGGSYDFEFSRSNVQLNKNYQFATCYNRTGSDFTSQVNTGGTFNFCPGIFSYNADGTKTVTKPSGTSFYAPDNVLAVDVTGMGITTATSAEPNCLFIIGKSDESPTGVGNVIVKGTSSYTANNIVLSDKSDFYSPVDFTASNIEFTFDNDCWADGSKGWNTIMLPFNVSEVTANGTAIDWFKSSTDTGKQFWLKKFINDDTSGAKVYFDFTDEMKAYTPYIIALPGNHWDSEYDLSGKTIKFIGQNVVVKKSERGVVTAENYRFIGNTQQDNTENIYCINNDGDKFILGNGSAPFRAFFKSDIFDRTVTSLAIGFDETTGIKSLTLTPAPIGEGNDAIYDLQGRRIGQWSALNSQLRPGLYIINGKKVIIKK